MSEQTITLDVREDIRAGREPFSKIMAVVARLQANEKLLLVAPFEPEPLYHVLAKLGFRPDAEQTAAGDWQVLFTRSEEKSVPATSVAPPSGGVAPPSGVLALDARGLEPPQPLVKILEALETLPVHTALHARTDRRPMHLYARLEERGFTGESQEQKDGSFLTHIRRR